MQKRLNSKTLLSSLAVLVLLTTSAVSAETIQWSTTALKQKTDVGKTFTFTCPPKGTSTHAVYGTDVYTADSSICLAAVHAGKITLAAGGEVTIKIGGKNEKYAGADRNGVTSRGWGPYPNSFSFAETGVITWSSNATKYADKKGEKFKFTCPPKGTLGAAVYGTDLYTTDSAICPAAVHAGKITADKGGEVKIKIKKGADKYEGTTRNGVTSRSWGPYGTAYKFK